MGLFKINGQAFTNLPIQDYTVKLSVVDTEGTGRTSAPGHPMFRHPAGTFYNLELTLGGAVINGQKEEFTRLVTLLEQYGKEGFHSVTFTAPCGEITQNMYCTAADFTLRTVSRWGGLFWKPLTLRFIAEKAWVMP